MHDIPNAFGSNRHAQAYFGIFKKNLPEVFAIFDEQVQDKWVRLSFIIDENVKTSVAENSINPQNIEDSIRRKLLPMMFEECRAIGGGVNQAKAIVELVVQVTRVGLAGNTGDLF